MKGLKINVLVVSQDEDLIRNLAGEESEDLSLRFVHNGYEASAVIHDFRPAFAVVDRDLIPDGGKELVECLTTDSRVPGLKDHPGSSGCRKTASARSRRRALSRCS